MKSNLKGLFSLLAFLLWIPFSSGQTWSTTNVYPTNPSVVSYATTGNVTVATMTSYVSWSSLVYTYSTPVNAGNGTMQIGFVGNFNNKTVYVSLTDNAGKTTMLDQVAPVLVIPYNATVTSSTATENYSIDWNLVNKPTGFDLTNISKVSLLLYNDAIATSSPSLTNAVLAVSLPVFGTGTTGVSTVTNPNLGQEWGLESSGYLYSNNNHGVIVGSPSANNIGGLLSYPYYNFIVNGRTNFVGNDNVIGIWSTIKPASGYRHYIGISNATFPNTTTEYSMINVYEWNSIANNGNPKHLTLQNFSDPNGSGNVGIGYHKSAPLEKLSVNGNIRCKQLIGTLQNWSDYVFTPEYKLRSLSEVKAYIEKEKHLPNIPSEKELIENGLNMNTMLQLQMEKIEELTLYVIKQEELLKAQQELIIRLSNRIDVLENKE